jgi:hypothetical protein
LVIGVRARETALAPARGDWIPPIPITQAPNPIPSLRAQRGNPAPPHPTTSNSNAHPNKPLSHPPPIMVYPYP